MVETIRALFFVLFGYLCGSVLFARVFSHISGKKDCFLKSDDKNPGSANVFKYGGFLCGLLTLLCDMLKGFLPVFLYLIGAETPLEENWLLIPVMAAPVIGGVFPVFFKFKGGKSFAAAAGCMLGLLPYYKPAAIIVFFLIIFSLILRITPDSYKIIFSTIGALIAMFFYKLPLNIILGYASILLIIYFKLYINKEKRERIKIRFLWMH